jgi:hypothetical protein
MKRALVLLVAACAHPTPTPIANTVPPADFLDLRADRPLRFEDLRARHSDATLEMLPEPRGRARMSSSIGDGDIGMADVFFADSRSPFLWIEMTDGCADGLCVGAPYNRSLARDCRDYDGGTSTMFGCRLPDLNVMVVGYELSGYPESIDMVVWLAPGASWAPPVEHYGIGD